MKIVALDGHTLNPGDNPWDPVKELGEFVAYPRTEATDIFSRADGAEILITNKVPLNAKMIHSLKRLRFIAITATGYNIVDIDAARERDIPVSNVPGYSTSSVAQHAFALLLELTNHVARHSTSVHNGDWIRSPDFAYWHAPLTELDGKTLGIFGFGATGQALARIGQALGMKILVSSRTRRETDLAVKWVSIEELAQESDVLSLHVPQTPETTGIIDRAFLSQMKPSAYLINTARGGLVSEPDLAAALNEGKIAGAGLDVISVEPMSDKNPLYQCRNCIITPHIAWASTEARKRLMQITADNIAAFLRGEPIHVVNDKSTA
ncbi:MAG TPA: D-2-hydroxyacid dehydrogenase [Opitutales bacterium]|nr:D-2-hydroxyacid dehydrogenase [Opitutales bacterium]